MCAGLSEITSLLKSNPQEKDTVVSCSATGKPTPVFSWWSGEKELSSYSSHSFTVQSEGSTVTTTSTLTIPKSQFSGKDVKCVAKSGGLTRSENIFVGKQTDKGKNSDPYIQKKNPWEKKHVCNI